MTGAKLPLLKPMLAVTAAPFDHWEYIFEIKWDGYRCLAYLDGNTELRSRNLINLSPGFPELLNLHRQAASLPAVLDGEIVILNNGLPSFSALQERGRLADPGRIKRAAAKMPAVYVVFDVLYAGGKPVLKEPLARRKEILSAVVPGGKNIIISDYVREEGRAFFQACAGRGLEGVVAKRLNSPYLPGKRSAHWKKIRRTRSAELVICGYEPGRGGALGSLILGGYKDGELVYQGKVGTGFTRREQQELISMLNKLVVKKPPLKVPKSEQRHPVWVKPQLVCEVHYTEITPEGRLRHPSYKGLRRDKEAAQCSAADGGDFNAR
ncbi:DNA ligase-1 [Desulfohalotomaculum tongense]|uniref:non-homologous end-joining DNA ligase n=1 Tax=Desulforadius tongensis TaxID=1216062 RepID=UPI00195E0097|nr:non-homologous end-joining DNA ligase [Desulforadius tongensis]MBM7854411.1 DNA ligase-1 [Desulforadius tongensis]